MERWVWMTFSGEMAFVISSRKAFCQRFCWTPRVTAAGRWAVAPVNNRKSSRQIVQVAGKKKRQWRWWKDGPIILQFSFLRSLSMGSTCEIWETFHSEWQVSLNLLWEDGGDRVSRWWSNDGYLLWATQRKGGGLNSQPKGRIGDDKNERKSIYMKRHHNMKQTRRQVQTVFVKQNKVENEAWKWWGTNK